MTLLSWRFLLLVVVVVLCSTGTSALPKQPSTSLASFGSSNEDDITRMIYKLSATTADGCMVNELNDDDLIVSGGHGHGSSSRSLALEDSASSSEHHHDELEPLTDHTLRGGATSPGAKNKASSANSNSALLQRLKVGVYFGVWYALNVIYNSK